MFLPKKPTQRLPSTQLYDVGIFCIPSLLRRVLFCNYFILLQEVLCFEVRPRSWRAFQFFVPLSVAGFTDPRHGKYRGRDDPGADVERHHPEIRFVRDLAVEPAAQGTGDGRHSTIDIVGARDALPASEVVLSHALVSGPPVIAVRSSDPDAKPWRALLCFSVFLGTQRLSRQPGHAAEERGRLLRRTEAWQSWDPGPLHVESFQVTSSPSASRRTRGRNDEEARGRNRGIAPPAREVRVPRRGVVRTDGKERPCRGSGAVLRHRNVQRSWV
mmetsp:Transcript_9131/g.18698  ORF Transcript_9131/g.18698 Transcript_9131/m.18698 type:complete len:272 (+) Transcript_9131:197-1012(+)